MNKFSILFVFLFATVIKTYSQGDGPKTMLLTPSNFTIINPVYMHLSSNVNASTNIQINNAKLTLDVIPLSVLYSFNIKGQYAQVFFTPNWVNISGQININDTNVDLPTISGFGDPFLAFRIGLLGAPALTLKEYLEYSPPNFQLFALFGTTVPIGKYDASLPINISSNRWMFRMSLPMVFNFTKNSALELTPTIKFFTKNKETFPNTIREQASLFVLESHFSHSFSKKFWSSIDMGYQYGGQTKTGDIEDNNTINQLGAGFSMGYQIIEPLSFAATYGRLWASDDNGHMIRVGLVLIIPSKKDIKEMNTSK